MRDKDKLYYESVELSRFSWDKKSRTLTADASDLGWGPRYRWPIDLYVRSHHTGNIECFERSQTITTPEGQFSGVVYEARNSALGIRATVFND